MNLRNIITVPKIFSKKNYRRGRFLEMKVCLKPGFRWDEPILLPCQIFLPSEEKTQTASIILFLNCWSYGCCLYYIYFYIIQSSSFQSCQLHLFCFLFLFSSYMLKGNTLGFFEIPFLPQGPESSNSLHFLANVFPTRLGSHM